MQQIRELDPPEAGSIDEVEVIEGGDLVDELEVIDESIVADDSEFKWE